MKRTASVIAIILSIVVITVIVVSLLNVRPPAPVTPVSTATATMAIFLTPTVSQTPDPCAPENIRATIAEFDKLSREFSDSFVLAQNTPAAQLSPVIVKMQEVRRRAEDFTIPTCLSSLKEYQLGFMNTAIDTSLILYSSFSGDTAQTITQDQMKKIIINVNQHMVQAGEYANKYAAEMAGLLGVTLTPSFTPEPADTPIPAGTTAAPLK